VQFWVPILEAIGNIEKSNMKMGQNFDPSFKEKGKCKLLENLTTSS